MHIKNIRLKDNLKFYWYACINTTVTWQTLKLDKNLNNVIKGYKTICLNYYFNVWDARMPGQNSVI